MKFTVYRIVLCSYPPPSPPSPLPLPLPSLSPSLPPLPLPLLPPSLRKDEILTLVAAMKPTAPPKKKQYTFTRSSDDTTPTATSWIIPSVLGRAKTPPTLTRRSETTLTPPKRSETPPSFEQSLSQQEQFPVSRRKSARISSKKKERVNVK